MDTMRPQGQDAGNGRRGRHIAAVTDEATPTAEPPPTGGLPQISDGFTAVRELGRGASATVWLATKGREAEPFAVKCLADSDTLRMGAVRREIRLHSGIDHAHLIRIHDAVTVAFQDAQAVGLVLDYAAGGSLRQLVASRGRLTVGETVTVLTPIAQALAYLHHRGSFHADVSPGNVLFTAHGKPLLSDFGLARMVGDPVTGLDAGTPGFTDPAPPLPGETVQPGRDVYSLAALGWYCLTGSPPGTSSRRPPLSIVVPGVPPNLTAALEAGLQEKTQERPTATEFATAVFRCAAPAPVDLSASVHPTVVPELLTRINPDTQKGFRRILRGAAWPAWIASPGGRALAGGARSGRMFGGNAQSGPRDALPGVPMIRSSRPRRRNAAIRQVTAVAPKPMLVVRALAAATLLAAFVLGGISVAAGWWRPGTDRTAGQQDLGAQADPRNGQLTEIAAGAAADGPGGAGAAAAMVPEQVCAQLAAEDPVQAVHGLAALRSLALRSGSNDLLGRVNAPGSPAAAADAALGSELQAAGAVLSGFTTTVSRADTLAGATTEKATVRVESSTSTYEERGPAGDVVRTGSAAGPQQLDLVLVRWEGAWRISEILPPPEP